MWNSGMEGAQLLDSATLKAMQNAQQTAAVLCCNCGLPVPQNISMEAGEATVAMCIDCIRATTDISTGIPREGVVQWCRGCNRYLQPPDRWIVAEPESRELLALLLRKLGKLQNVRLVDAGFIWTEPHSRRIKITLTIEKEVMHGTILQQTFNVEFTVAGQQCRDCAKTYTAHTWQAVVQVRQHVSHKRTFLYLEQLIIKHNAHMGCINVKETKDGVDFFWAHRSEATKFVEFISNVSPIQFKTSEELVSADLKSNTANFKYTFSVEIVPICREDLTCLPKSLAAKTGNISQLVLCQKVGTSVHVIDPITLQSADITSAEFWRQPFSVLADHAQLVEFDVLDVELLGPTSGKFALADIEVMRSVDMLSGGQSYLVRSHLGALLHPGDVCMGYFIVGSNYNNEIFDKLKSDHIPDVVLVKKIYPRRYRKNRNRNWKLKQLAREEPEFGVKKQEIERREQEFELFLREIEEDPELRQTISLYKKKQAPESMDMDEKEVDADNTLPHEETNEDEITDHDEVPGISMDELLDDLDDLEI